MSIESPKFEQQTEEEPELKLAKELARSVEQKTANLETKGLKVLTEVNQRDPETRKLTDELNTTHQEAGLEKLLTERKMIKEVSSGELLREEFMAKIYGHLIEEIIKNPNQSFEELDNLIEEFSQKTGFELSINEEITVANLLELYEQRKKLLENLSEIYRIENKLDGPAIYEFATGLIPKGKIEVLPQAGSLAFMCQHADDFALPRFGRLDIPEKKEELIKKINELIKGYNLLRSQFQLFEKCFIFISPTTTKEELPQVLRHEEQHSLNALFQQVIEESVSLDSFLNEDSSQEEKNSAIKRYIRSKMGSAYEKARDEILASITQLTDVEKDDPGITEFIKRRITSMKKSRMVGGSYDYLYKEKNIISEGLKKEGNVEAAGLVEEIMVDEYSRTIESAFLAAQKIFKHTEYNPNEIIGLLITKPIQEWDRWAEKLTN